MNERISKSHLVGYIDSMMKTKVAEFRSSFPEITTKNKISIVSIDIPQGEASGESIDEPIGEAVDRPTYISIESPTEQSVIQSAKQSIDQSIQESIDKKEINLNVTQYTLYYCLQKINGRITNLVKISAELNISNNTLKSALNILKLKEVIQFYERANCAGLQGFRAIVTDSFVNIIGGDEDKLKRKLNTIDYEAMCIDGKKIINNLSSRLMPDRLPHPLGTSSDSIINNKLLLQEIEDCFDYHPDFSFWKNENISPQIIIKWMNEFGIPIDKMVLYMSECVFDIVNNIKDNLRTSPTSYFYGCLKKNNIYFRPKDYLTIEERRLAELKKIVDEKERIISELQDFENKKKKAELDLNFRGMMSDKNSELYQKCYLAIPSIFRNEKNQGYMTSMKEAYKKIVTSNPEIESEERL